MGYQESMSNWVYLFGSAGVIALTVALLGIAMLLIFWKPGKKSRYRFVRLSIGNLLIHLADGFITFANTPGLEREANPLVSRFGLGWGALFLANLIVFGFIVLCAWCFCRYEHVPLAASGVADYFMRLLYGEGYKPAWFWYKLPHNRRSLCAVCGCGLYWGLTLGATVPVLGWLLVMLKIHPIWWNSVWISVGIGCIVCVFSMYRWSADGYRCGPTE